MASFWLLDLFVFTLTKSKSSKYVSSFADNRWRCYWKCNKNTARSSLMGQTSHPNPLPAWTSLGMGKEDVWHFKLRKIFGCMPHQAGIPVPLKLFFIKLQITDIIEGCTPLRVFVNNCQHLNLRDWFLVIAVGSTCQSPRRFRAFFVMGGPNTYLYTSFC